MNWSPAGISGAWLFTPSIHEDERGIFLESYTAQSLLEATGVDMNIAQLNISVSRKGAIRGLHACQYPHQQAKYIQCVSGSVLDVVVDIDPKSCNFGEHTTFILNDEDRNAVFVDTGLAHGVAVLSDWATLVYATSSPYNPDAEIAIHPLDPQLGISWLLDQDPVLSERDSAAPTLQAALASGLIGR